VYQHPAVHETLMRDRVAALRQAAPATTPAPFHVRPGTGRRRGVAAARYGIGWLLVDLGLRLAAPRRAANRPMARGYR
jgi:hypothetical protein